MVGVVEPQTPHNLDLVVRERCEELGDREYGVKDLRRGVERGPDDLEGLDGCALALRPRPTVLGVSSSQIRRCMLADRRALHRLVCPICTREVSAATNRMRRVHCCGQDARYKFKRCIC